MDEFRTERDGPVLRVYREGHREVLDYFDRPTHGLGRGRPLRVDGLILKRYFRGGLIRFLGDRYFTSRPAMREIEVAEHLRSRGVGAPEILAVEARRSGIWVRLALVSREIPQAERFSDFLRTRDGVARSRRIRSVAQAVRELHQSGVFHGDLNVENILLSPTGVHFVDFDQSRIFDGISAGLQARELRRLMRSAVKRRIAISQSDIRRFLLGYVHFNRALLAEMGLAAGHLSR